MSFPVPSGIANLLGLGGSKTWEDRLREAAYTSPKSKTRILFLYEDVSRTVEARGTAWEFPGVDGAYVQRTGFGARRYPMRCFFSGADHDRIAAAFLSALLEPGTGKLEHPLYGTIKVVPFGEITERQDLRNAANQSILEVTFWTTLKTAYPSDSKDAADEIAAQLDGFDVAAAQKFSDGAFPAGAAKAANLKSTIRGFLGDVSGALQSVSDTTASVKREFDDNIRLINRGIDVFIGQPLLLAQQIRNLIEAPSRALAGILSRLEGYAALAERIFGSDAGSPPSGAGLPIAAARLALVRANFETADLFAGHAVAGSIRSSLNVELKTKPEALRAAERIGQQFDELVAWQDAGRTALESIDTGETYQALRSATALALGRLVEASFSLVQERRIVIDRPRTIIDLAAELYGEVDTRLDFLISSNALTGSEILELPTGTSVLYYPD